MYLLSRLPCLYLVSIYKITVNYAHICFYENKYNPIQPTGRNVSNNLKENLSFSFQLDYSFILMRIILKRIVLTIHCVKSVQIRDFF